MEAAEGLRAEQPGLSAEQLSAERPGLSVEGLGFQLREWMASLGGNKSENSKVWSRQRRAEGLSAERQRAQEHSVKRLSAEQLTAKSPRAEWLSAEHLSADSEETGAEGLRHEGRSAEGLSAEGLRSRGGGDLGLRVLSAEGSAKGLRVKGAEGQGAEGQGAERSRAEGLRAERLRAQVQVAEGSSISPSAPQPLSTSTPQLPTHSATQPPKNSASQPLSHSAAQPLSHSAAQPTWLRRAQGLVLSASALATQHISRSAAQPPTKSATQPLTRSAPQPFGRSAAVLALLWVAECLVLRGCALAPPPHERACPGPLDAGNAALCAVSGNVTLATSVQLVELSAGRLDVEVQRVGGFAGAGSVSYQLLNGTAKQGIEFVGAEGVLSWSENEGQPRRIVVRLIDTGNYSAGKFLTTFQVRLSDPVGLQVGQIPLAEISIRNSNARTGVIAMTTPSVVVGERAGSVAVNVSRSGGSDCNVLVFYRTVVIAESDYGHYGLETQRGPLSWPEGDDSLKQISIPITDNSQIQNAPGEEFFIEIYDDLGGCAPIGEDRTRVTVTDDDQVGFLRIIQQNLEVKSDAGSFDVEVERIFGSANPISADYITIPGVANEAEDFVAQSGILVWEHGETDTKKVTIQLRNGAGTDSLQRDMALRITYVTGTSLFDAVDESSVTILNVRATPGLVAFSVERVCSGPSLPPAGRCVYVTEGQASASLRVKRFGGTQGSISVNYQAEAVTPDGVGDFVGSIGTVTWASGDSSDKFVVVSLLTDAAFSPIVEFFKVTLLEAGALVPVVDTNNSVAYVAVIDKDGGGSLTIEAQKGLVYESEGEALFTLRRIGAGLGQAEVVVETVEGEALNDIDFTPVSTTIVFADGDTSPRNVSVPLIVDSTGRFDTYLKHFFVKITNYSSNTFADPRSEIAAVYVADDGSATGVFLFDSLDWDPLNSSVLNSPAQIYVTEDAGFALVTVVRVRGYQTNVTVPYSTQGITAVAGKHFESVSGYLFWPEGDVSNRTIRIPIIADGVFEAQVSTRTLRVTLGKPTVSFNDFKTQNYNGPASVEAVVSIAEVDGQGILEFQETEIYVSEGQSQVNLTINRVGGLNFDAELKYITRPGTATAPFSSESSFQFVPTSFRTSCQGAPSSGTYQIQAIDGSVREVYCDMSDDSTYGSASIFMWDGTQTLWERTCIAHNGDEGLQKHILWGDYSSRFSTSTERTTDTNSFGTWKPHSGMSGPTSLSDRPHGVGDEARPVSLPFHNRTIWLDWQNEMVVWLGKSFSDSYHNVSFRAVGIQDGGQLGDSASNLYFITDGISMVHVGFEIRNVSTFNETSNVTTLFEQHPVLLRFDWVNNSVAWELAKPLTLDSGDRCSNGTQHSFGHLLWTVNGRVMYRNCSGNDDSNSLRMVLGGTIQDPMSKADYYEFSVCPGGSFAQCAGWTVNTRNLSIQSGLDLFAAVDPDGFLFFGHSGPGGGLFSCGTQNYFGFVRTHIELGRVVTDDYVPIVGDLTWLAGDSSPRTITIDILQDNVLDSVVQEYFTVELDQVRRAAASATKSVAKVVIRDEDGPGLISVHPTRGQGPVVGERQYCCKNCESQFSNSEREWCSYFEVSRSAGRGPICVDVSTEGKMENGNLTAEMSVHFIRFNETLCWSHKDSESRNITVRRPFHQTFDKLHKNYTIKLQHTKSTGLKGFNVKGSHYSTGSEAGIGPSYEQDIEDQDAKTGFVTFDADPNIGSTVSTFANAENTALVSVSRQQATDLDLTIEFTTSVYEIGRNLSGIESTITLQTAVSAADGSHGTNTFCVSSNEKIAGACVDSSGAASCSSGKCSSFLTVQASPATEASTFNAPGSHYMTTTGRLYWAAGVTGFRRLAVPLFYPEEALNSTSGAPFRYFRVTLTSAIASEQGRTMDITPLSIIKSKNAISDCDIETCQTNPSDDVVSQCTSSTCRLSATSEAFVSFPASSGGGIVRLVNNTYFVREDISGGFMSVAVQRVGGSLGQISVQYEVNPTSIPNFTVPAIPGYDFEPVNGSLSWSDGDAEDRSIDIPIINDGQYTQGRLWKSFKVNIFGASGGVSISPNQRESTAIIVDDDPVTGTLQIYETLKVVDEDTKTVSLRVARVGGNDTAVYARFHTGLKSMWDTTTTQTGNSSAHSLFLSEQSYACQTTLEGTPSASYFTSLRGGGAAAFAFDFNLNTFWDSSGNNGDPQTLEYAFSACNLYGAKITAYKLYTQPSGDISGCPASWSFQGSNDGIAWTDLDTQVGIGCTPAPLGQQYMVSTNAQGFWLFYRFRFTRDQKGFVDIRINEVFFTFENEGSSSSNLVQAQMCSALGDCCIFDAESCSPMTGHTFESLRELSHDYLFNSGLLMWEEGDTSMKTFSVSLLDDCMGCAPETCDLFDQNQDKPYEYFPVQLTVPSDLEIRRYTTNLASIYPYRKDAVFDLDNSNGRVLVRDDDGPGIISLVTTSCGERGGRHVPAFMTEAGIQEPGNDAECPVLETASTIDFFLTRTGGSRGAITVDYRVEAGANAIENVDFEPTNGTLTWSHGDSAGKGFSVRLSNSSGYEAGRYSRTIIAKLSGIYLEDGTYSLSGGAQLRACEREVLGLCTDPERREFAVKLIDDDAVPGTIAISSLSINADRSLGTVDVVVTRTGGQDLPLIVSYETVQISETEARPCLTDDTSQCEYFPVSGNLTWDDQDSSSRTISIVLTPQQPRREFEKFRFKIQGKANDTVEFCGGYEAVFEQGLFSGYDFKSLLCDVAYLSEATITFQPPSNQGLSGAGFFELLSQPAPYIVTPEDEVAYFAISRDGGTDGIVSVQFDTQGLPQYGSAEPNTHFLYNLGTLEWGDGEGPSYKTIALTLLAGSLSPNTFVELKVRILSHSSNSGLVDGKTEARVLIQTANYIPVFSSGSVSETSQVQLDDNTLTIGFSLTTILAEGARITITGMTNAGTASNNMLPISGSDASIFGGTGDWDSNAGTLTLEVAAGQTVEYEQSVSIEVTLTNGPIAQNARTLAIQASYNPVCAAPTVSAAASAAGLQLACPKPISIDLTLMSGQVLTYSIGAFAASAESHMCIYSTCPHSEFHGAWNNVTVELRAPQALVAGSTLTLSGLSASSQSASDTEVPISVSNLVVPQGGANRNVTAPCICRTVACQCEHTFQGIPPQASSISLTIQIQCNSLGWVSTSNSGESISVQIGSSTTYSSTGTPFPSFVLPGQTCEDSCDIYHDLLISHDVSSIISETGQLYVAISSSADVDFCGQGHYIDAILTVTWTTTTVDLATLTGTWDSSQGNVVLTVPPGYTIPQVDNGDPLTTVKIMLPIKNPAGDSPGSTMFITANTGGTTIGPSTVTGPVMISTRQAGFAEAILEESNPAQSADNIIIIQFTFSGDIGASSQGLWITLSGLLGTQTPDNPRLPISTCTVCRFPPETYLDLATLAPTAEWKQSDGSLRFFIRGPSPTYLIKRTNIVGTITLKNAPAAQLKALPKFEILGEMVPGSGEVPDFLVQPTDQYPGVLSASVSLVVFSESDFSYADVAAYSGVKEITVSLVSLQDLFYKDEITFSAPSLSTCATFCYDGICRQTRCSDIDGFFVNAQNSSLISGGFDNFFQMFWDESAKQIKVVASAGRALCANTTFSVSFSPEDYGCDNYDCALKVLPDDIAETRGQNLLSTPALGCESGGAFCSPTSTSTFENAPVDLSQASYWGQVSTSLDPSQPHGYRSWFSTVVHSGAMYILGGVYFGLQTLLPASTVRVSTDGVVWTDVVSEESVLAHRAYFPSVSAQNHIWVLGGAYGNKTEATRDVWKSTDARSWCLVTAQAAWPARHHHAAVFHNQRLWVIGGESEVGGRDVWSSDVGVYWRVETWSAAFSPRKGHAVVSFGNHLVLYAGGSESDVWKSEDGIIWSVVTASAPWENRQLSNGVVFDGNLWLIGGWTNQSRFSDVWYSRDGSVWESTTTAAQWGARYGASTTAFIDRLWVLGGSPSAQPGASARIACEGFYVNCSGNDVWKDAFGVIHFTQLEISQGTNVIGADNEISVVARVDSDVVNQSKLILSPLMIDQNEPKIDIAGPNSSLFDGQATWVAGTKSLELVLAKVWKAQNELRFTITVRNWWQQTDPGVLRVSIELRSSYFSALSGSTWASIRSAAFPASNVLDTSNRDSRRPEVFDGGIMFDVQATQAIYVNGFSVGLQEDAISSSLVQEIDVYYKEGSHLTAVNNLSEWRQLGSISAYPTDSEQIFQFLLSDLKAHEVATDVKFQPLCDAANFQCVTSSQCTQDQCFCRDDEISAFAEDQELDLVPYAYAERPFCQGEIYCYDNSNASCICTHGKTFTCEPGQTLAAEWLGPRSEWIEEGGVVYNSSSLGRNVNLSGLLDQHSTGMWHSGEAGNTESECPHLPWCPESWPYQKDQWLAFDAGVMFTLSAFRTTYPDFAEVPSYYYLGNQRTNIVERYWKLGHFKDFEFQYSSTSVEGPWTTVLGGTARYDVSGWQVFTFEPSTARYWRLLMKTNYGFGYMALKALEFYGFESIWHRQSKWCDNSIQCEVAGGNSVRVEWDSVQRIRSSGIGLSAGTHSFYLRSTAGFNMTISDSKRGDVQHSDAYISVHHGSRRDHQRPMFAWQSLSNAFESYSVVDAQSLTDSVVNAADGITIVAQFQTSRGVNDGTLVAIGNDTNAGLTVVVRNNSIFLEQTLCEYVYVTSNSTSCANFTMTNDTASASAQQNNSSNSTTSVSNATYYTVVRCNNTNSSDWLLVCTMNRAEVQPTYQEVETQVNYTKVGKQVNNTNQTISFVESNTTNVSTPETAEPLSLASDAKYCLIATIRDNQIQASLQRHFPLDLDHVTKRVYDFPLLDVPEFKEVVIGASNKCGADKFPGALTAASVYGGQLGPDEMKAACWRRCETVTSDGSCLDPAKLQVDQELSTAGATDWTFMTLPVKEQCYKSFKLKVDSTTSEQVGKMCMADFVLYGSVETDWIPIEYDSSVLVSSSTEDAMFPLDNLLLGNTSITSNSKQPFCSANGDSSIYILFEFASLTCVKGYSLRATDDSSMYTMPSTWTLQGSVDGVSWHLLDSKRGISWQPSEWKRYRPGKEAPFLFVTNLVNTSQDYGYSTHSRLYNWLGDTDGWRSYQDIATRGAREAEHFVISGKNYLVIAGARDGSTISSARNGGYSLSDSQVGSDIFLWDGAWFEIVDALSTNVTAQVSHFIMEREHYLISADHRVPLHQRDPEKGYSILFRRRMEEGDGSCGAILQPCQHCSCATLQVGVARGVGQGSAEYSASAAFDGDDSTFWVGNFSSAAENLNYPNETVQLSTSNLALGLEFNFTGCSGTEVTGYSLTTTNVYCPRSWQFQAWNGSVWVTIDSQEDQDCHSEMPKTFLVGISGIYQAYRFAFLPMRTNGTVLPAQTVAVAEIDFLFKSEDNRFVHSAEKGTQRIYHYEPFGPPFLSVYMDSDGFPVPALKPDGTSMEGVVGVFEVEMISGSAVLSSSEDCSIGNFNPNATWVNDSLAPFRSCVKGRDLCQPSAYPVCFEGSQPGVCVNGLKSGSECGNDSDCGLGSSCLAPQKYLYKISFRTTVRLITIRLRGCGWCQGNVSVLREDMTVISIVDRTNMSDCSKCISWQIDVDSVGKVFYLEDRNLAQYMIREGFGLQFEPFSSWEEVQLLDTTNANDFEYFTIADKSFLVVANYRAMNDCYGEFDCVNPEGSVPLTLDTKRPYNIDSAVFLYNSSFELYQSIPTRGALDWEFFVINGDHFLAVANSFDSEFSTDETNSVIYKWNASKSLFVVYQEILTVDARSWKHWERDGVHLLIMASGGGGIGMAKSRIYRWNGERFVLSQTIPTMSAISIEPYSIGSNHYLAVAESHKGEDTNINSTVFRWQDTLSWHGKIHYSTAFSPRATFQTRLIQDTTSISDADNNITITLRPDRWLRIGTKITISGLLGSNTIIGALPLGGPDSAVFGYSAEWNPTIGQIVLMSEMALSPSQETSVSVVLRNGVAFRDSVQPSISSRDEGNIIILPVAMTGKVMGVNTSAEAMFTDFLIGESSTYQYDQSNLITVTLRANLPIVNGSLIEIAGLTGTRTASTDVFPLASPDCTFISRNGTWDRGLGRVTIPVSHPGVPAYTFCRVTFTLINGISEQAAVQPNVTASWVVRGKTYFNNTINETVTIPDENISLPFLDSIGTVLSFSSAPAWRQVSIESSTSVVGATNTIFVTLWPYLPLQTGFIRIEGLEDVSLTASTTQISIRNQGSLIFTSATSALFSLSNSRLSLEFGCSTCDEDAPCDCADVIPADRPTTLEFDLPNSLTKVSAKTPTIYFEQFRSAGGAVIPQVAMTDSAGNPAQVLETNTKGTALDLVNVQVSSNGDVAWPKLKQFTVETWVKTGATTGAMMSIGGGSLLLEVMALNQLGVTIDGDQFTVSSMGFNDGTWHHIVISWQSDAGSAHIFLDSTSVHTENNVRAGATLNLANGQIVLGTALTTISFAEIRLWGVALSSSSSPSVQTLYNKFLTGLRKPASLLASYSFRTDGSDFSVFNRSIVVPDMNGVAISEVSDGSQLDGFVYPRVVFTTKSVSASPAYHGSDSCVTVQLAVDYELGPGAVITISGFTGLQNRAQIIPISSTDIASYANWDQTLGTLTLTLEKQWTAGPTITIDFNVINPMQFKAARTITISARDGNIMSEGNTVGSDPPAVFAQQVLEVIDDASTCSTSAVADWIGQECPGSSYCSFDTELPCRCQSTCPQAFFKAPSSELAGANSTWITVMEVTDSTAIGSHLNNVSFIVQPDRILPAGSNLTISGLTGTMTEDRQADAVCLITGLCFLSISGESAHLFNLEYGIWLQASGEVHLQLRQDMIPETPHYFSLILQNSMHDRTSVVPSISVSGQVPVPAVFMCGSVLEVNHTAFYFLHARYDESTCDACKLNSISVELQPSNNLTIGTIIRLREITSTLTPSGKVSLKGPDHFRFEHGIATLEDGDLSLIVGLYIEAGSMLSFSFDIHNYFRSQQPLRISATIHPVEADPHYNPVVTVLRGGALSSQGVEFEDLPSPASWIATGYQAQEEYHGTDAVWLEIATGSCCAGTCCPAESCCGCSALALSGTPHFKKTGLYFAGSACQVYCDMETDGGGWTLISVHTNSDGSTWSPEANSSDQTQLQSLYASPNAWESDHGTLGDPDVSMDADFRSWAFFQTAGDGHGAGDQVMVTYSREGGAKSQPLLVTDGNCLGKKTMASMLAGISWECSGAEPSLVNYSRANSSVFNKILAADPCSHACKISASFPATTSIEPPKDENSSAVSKVMGVNESVLLGGEPKEFLFLKAGVSDLTSATSKHRVYMSTELRDKYGLNHGLGSYCEGSACSASSAKCDSSGATPCQLDVAGFDDDAGGGEGLGKYLVWVRRAEMWVEDCQVSHDQRQGHSCDCCYCGKGSASNGATCIECPHGTYKDQSGFIGCSVCPGTSNLPVGQTECAGTVEIFAITGPDSEDGSGLDIHFSVYWSETQSWSQDFVVAGSSSVISNSTFRFLFEGVRATGTPSKIRYSLDPTPNSDTWRPAMVAVRVNKGLWYETTQMPLCPVDGYCASAALCAGRAPAGCSVTRSAEYPVSSVQ